MRAAARMTCAATAAVLVISAAGGIAVAAEAMHRPAPAHSVGPVPWVEAVVTTREARTLTVLADVEAVAQRTGCDALTAYPVVQESAREVRIRVEVLDHPARPDTICTADLLTRLRVPVHLRGPVAGRQLVDAVTRQVRQPLAPDAVESTAGHAPSDARPADAG